MKRIVYLLLMITIYSNCTHRIVRTGYNVTESDYRSCDIVIKKYAYVSEADAKKIGEIKLGERGFAVACSESHAINILKREACAINADLIVIVEEKRPNFQSSCYKCRAKFYRYYSTINVQSDKIYESERIRDRVTKDRIKFTMVIMGYVAAGFMLGILLFPN